MQRLYAGEAAAGRITYNSWWLAARSWKRGWLVRIISVGQIYTVPWLKFNFAITYQLTAKYVCCTMVVK